jgi:hypothetical protein
MSPKDVYQFHLQATAAVPGKAFDLDLITPFLTKKTKVKTHDQDN